MLKLLDQMIWSEFKYQHLYSCVWF